MKLKKFLGMYDNWNKVARINDDNLKTIIEDETKIIYETRPDLLNKKVVSFGMYDDTLTIRIK